ncbi:MAG: molybdenum cofactor guanylyltransferase MobA [Rhodobacteraceae bacterium]|nr:molybdenum cofactor guanylyltransferase MobA [Paracoccaceae bacterium]
MKVAGVILAGGQARRMGGGDKGLLPLHGRPVLSRIVARLAPQVETMVLNANGDAIRFSEFGLPVVADSIAGHAGPLAGVLAGMDWAAANGYEALVSVASDSPFFPLDLVKRLLEARQKQGTPLAMAHSPKPGGGFFRQPTFTLYRVSDREALRKSLENGLRKVILWTGPMGCATCIFEEPDAFFNINTPQDLAIAEARK